MQDKLQEFYKNSFLFLKKSETRNGNSHITFDKNFLSELESKKGIQAEEFAELCAKKGHIVHLNDNGIKIAWRR